METKDIDISKSHLSIDGSLDEKFVVKILATDYRHDEDFYLTKEKCLVPRRMSWREDNRGLVECNSYREAMGLAKSVLHVGKLMSGKLGDIKLFLINGFKK